MDLDEGTSGPVVKKDLGLKYYMPRVKHLLSGSRKVKRVDQLKKLLNSQQVQRTHLLRYEGQDDRSGQQLLPDRCAPICSTKFPTSVIMFCIAASHRKRVSPNIFPQGRKEGAEDYQ